MAKGPKTARDKTDETPPGKNCSILCGGGVMFGMEATRIALSIERLKVGGVGAVGMRDPSTPARVVTLRRAALLAGVSCAALAVLGSGRRIRAGRWYLDRR